MKSTLTHVLQPHFDETVIKFFVNQCPDRVQRLKDWFSIENKNLLTSPTFNSLLLFIAEKLETEDPLILDLAAHIGVTVRHVCDTGFKDLPLKTFDKVQRAALKLLSETLSQESRQHCAIIVSTFKKMPKNFDVVDPYHIFPLVADEVIDSINDITIAETPQLCRCMTALYHMLENFELTVDDDLIDGLMPVLKKILLSPNKYSYLFVSRTWKVTHSLAVMCTVYVEWIPMISWICTAIPETMLMPLAFDHYPKEIAVYSAMKVLVWYIDDCTQTLQSVAQNPALIEAMRTLLLDENCPAGTHAILIDGAVEFLSHETVHDLERLVVDQALFDPIIALAGSKREHFIAVTDGITQIVDNTSIMFGDRIVHGVFHLLFEERCEDLGFEDLAVAYKANEFVEIALK